MSRGHSRNRKCLPLDLLGEIPFNYRNGFLKVVAGVAVEAHNFYDFNSFTIKFKILALQYCMHSANNRQ